MKNDKDLGPVLEADGTEVNPNENKLDTERKIEFSDPQTKRRYRAIIDLMGITRGLDSNYALAQFAAAKDAGFSNKEIQDGLDKIDPEDPRAQILLELQHTHPKIVRAEAAIANAVWVKWNVPKGAPSVEDLKRGGVYGAYVEAVNKIVRPTSAPSEAEGATI